MLALAGTRLGLIPHPARVAQKYVVLVEGPPDMIAARTRGLAAIAVPGTSAWQPAWAQLLEDKHVTLAMDCDEPGRRAAVQITASLRAAGIPVDAVGLAPGRNDGYDLTDRIIERKRHRPDRSASGPSPRFCAQPRPSTTPAPEHTPATAGGNAMTEIPDAGNGSYTNEAHIAILTAVRAEHDFGGWLAGVLATVAADLGSTEALTAGRPGSWEAEHVRGLVNGTVGWDDEYLEHYRVPLA